MRITPIAGPLLDPRLRTALPVLWPSRCTIQTITTTTSASNQLVPSGAVDLAGHTEIECRVSPIVRERPTDDLQRGYAVQEYHLRRHANLNGYFPTITEVGMQAVIDGVVYPIRGVDTDGNHFITRLKLEVVTPHG